MPSVSAVCRLDTCTPPGLIDGWVWTASFMPQAASNPLHLPHRPRDPAATCRDMVVLLKDTYPAALVSDLRHFSIAALYDVFGAFPESFVATSPPNVPPENLNRFISTVEALVTISRNHVGDTAENLFSQVAAHGAPSKRLSLPSLPSVQASPRAAHPGCPRSIPVRTCNHALRCHPVQGTCGETQRPGAVASCNTFCDHSELHGNGASYTSVRWFISPEKRGQNTGQFVMKRSSLPGSDVALRRVNDRLIGSALGC